MKKLFLILFITTIISCNNTAHQTKEEPSAVSYTPDKTFVVETSTSNITWTGRELSSSYHFGTLDFISGQIEIFNGLITGGEFVVDMNSLRNLDLEGDRKSRLEGHLRSDDFFSVESHPTALLNINDSTLISEGKWDVTADLTIKGTTHSVNFEIIKTEQGWSANLVFDRSKYDVRFRSGTFFENLGDKLIYDDIELVINLTTI